MKYLIILFSAFSFSWTTSAVTCASLLSENSYDFEYSNPHDYIVIHEDKTDYFIPFADHGIGTGRRSGLDLARDNLRKADVLQNVLNLAGVSNIQVNPGMRAIRLSDTEYSSTVGKAYSQVYEKRYQLARQSAIRRVFGYDQTESSIAEAKEQLEKMTGEPVLEPSSLSEEIDDNLGYLIKHDVTALDGALSFDSVEGRSLEELFNDSEVSDREKMKILHKFNSGLKKAEAFLQGSQDLFLLDRDQQYSNEAQIDQNFGVRLGPATAPIYPYELILSLIINDKPVEIIVMVSDSRIIYGNDGVFYIRQFE